GTWSPQIADTIAPGTRYRRGRARSNRDGGPMPSIKRGTGWLAAGVALSAASCARDAVSPRPDRGRAVAPQDVAATTDNVTIQWDNAALQAIRVTKPGPPIVARALAIVHTTMYDAWAAYDD